jgi:putative addiction module component (TIGR02574 family)
MGLRAAGRACSTGAGGLDSYDPREDAGTFVNKATLLAEIMGLPEDERNELVVEVWDSLISSHGWMPTPDQLAEARRRLEDHRRNPSTAIPAEQVLARLKSRFG